MVGKGGVHSFSFSLSYRVPLFRLLPLLHQLGFVCGAPVLLGQYKGTGLVFCTLSFVCALLFFSATPGASQQNAPFHTDSMQMQTLHSIMTIGVHSSAVSPAREQHSDLDKGATLTRLIKDGEGQYMVE